MCHLVITTITTHIYNFEVMRPVNEFFYYFNWTFIILFVWMIVLIKHATNIHYDTLILIYVDPVGQQN